MSRYRGVERFCRYRTPVALILDKAFGPAPEPTPVENFRLARNAVANVLAVPAFDIVIRASQTSGPAPMGVVFNMLDDSTFPGIERPEAELSFWFDYGDEGSVYENVSSELGRNNANIGQGGIHGHVFESVGTYTVKAYCYQHSTGKFGYAEVEITTSDADAYYSGTNTVCLDPSGVFLGAPTGSQQFTAWSSARSAMLTLGNDARLLIAKGQEVLVDVFNLYIHQRCQYGVFGEGAAPHMVFNIKPTNPSLRVFFGEYWRHPTENSIVWGMDFETDYNVLTGVGEGYKVAPLFGAGMRGVTFWRNRNRGSTITVYNYNDSENLVNNTLVVDNDIADWQDLPIFGHFRECPILGNRIRQNPSATSDVTAKRNFNGLVDKDGAELTYTLPNLAIFGDVANLALFMYDTVSFELTELVLDTDFTFTAGIDAAGPTSGDSTHSATLSSEIPVDNQLYYHTRRYPRHGPIRLEQADGVTIAQNDLFSRNGWSSDGQAHQPTIRWNTSGNADAYGFINQNRLEGGYNNISSGPQNDWTPQGLPRPLVIESNLMIGSDNTISSVSVRLTNVFIRNNVAIKSNVQNTFGDYYAFVGISKNTATTDDLDIYPIEVINNTVVNLTSVANGAEDTVPVAVIDDAFPTVVDKNNLLYHPLRPTPWPVDYSPLDEDNYYQPLEGSPAIDSGTPDDLVWDDLLGNLVGETSSVGAFDTAYEPPFTQAEFTRSPATAAQSSSIVVPSGSNWKLTHEFIIPSTFSTVSGLIALVKDEVGSGGGITRIVFDSGSNPNGPNRIYLGGQTTNIVNDATVVNDGLPHTLVIEYVQSENLFYLYADDILSGTGAPEAIQQTSGTFAITINNYRANLGSEFNATLYCNHIALNTEFSINDSVVMAFDYSSGALNGETEDASQGTGTLLMYGDPIWS